MSRPLPDVFKNKDTYGISISSNRGRLPVIAQGKKGSLKQVLYGKKGWAIRVAMAGLQVAEDVEDVARLVLGAIIDGSEVGKTRAALNDPHEGKWADKLVDWSIAAMMAQHAGADDTKADSDEDLSLPNDVFPPWIEDLGIDPALMHTVSGFDEMEVAAYSGILAFAIGKQPTAENLPAFNANRRNAVTQFMTKSELNIFVDESPFLSLDVLGKVNRAFNSVMNDRSLVMSAIVDADDALVDGTARMFYVLFRLLSGTSLNPLMIVLRFGIKYPGMYKEFPDLETEYHAIHHAIQRFYDTSEARRMYLKVIFGSAYVPVDRNDINHLLGLATFVLKQSDTSLENYQGGILSVAHREKAVKLLGIKMEEEEAVPESN